MTNDEGMITSVATCLEPACAQSGVPFQREGTLAPIALARLCSRFGIASSRMNSRHGFTIIELLIVIAVIIVLAGLVLGTSSYVQNKGARSRAEAEIAAMSAALESYKADNGEYPTADATVALTPANADPGAYHAASLVLYQALSGDTGGDRAAEQKTYMSFKPTQLMPASPPNSQVTALRDPFGDPYGYSTAKNPQANQNFATAVGYNPTFDLWTTAGEQKKPDETIEEYQKRWITNW